MNTLEKEYYFFEQPILINS